MVAILNDLLHDLRIRTPGRTYALDDLATAINNLDEDAKWRLGEGLRNLIEDIQKGNKTYVSSS